MAIRVIDGYRGRPSQEKFIPAGVYEKDDPALYGAGAYLLANGFAEEVSRFQGVRADDTPSDPLLNLKVEQLKELATAHEIDLGDATNKADIVAALRASGKLPEGQ